jgi:hypothetical protein
MDGLLVCAGYSVALGGLYYMGWLQSFFFPEKMIVLE